jgi:hypothetical protein
MLLECKLGTQQVQAQRFVTGQLRTLDAGEGGRSSLDLAFLAPGFGGLQAIAVGVAG